MGFNFSGTGGSRNVFDFSKPLWEDNSATLPYDITPSTPIPIKFPSTPISPITQSKPLSMADFRKSEDVTPLLDIPSKKNQFSLSDTLSNLGKGFWEGGIRKAAEGYKTDGEAILYALQKETEAKEKRLGIAPTDSGKSYINPFASSVDIKRKYDDLQSQVPYEPTDTAGKVGSMAGFLAGSAPAFMFGGAATEGLASKAIEKIAPKISPKIMPYAERAVKDSLGFAPIGLMESNKLSDVPKNVGINMATGAVLGPAAVGAGKLIGKGIGEVKDILKPLGVPPEPFGPSRTLAPIEHSFKRGTGNGPLKISDTLTPEYKARQAELSDTFKDLPIGSVDTPMARRTLQEGIDTNLGINKPTGEYQGLDAFGKPIKTFRKSTDLQNSIEEVSAQLDNQLKGMESMIKNADEQTPVGTIRKAIFDKGGIKSSNDGIFEEKRIIPNWIRNENGIPLDQMADELGMTSDELLKAVNDSKYVPRDYAKEAEIMARNDPEYQANSDLLETLKGQLPGKRTLGVTPKPEIISDSSGKPLTLYHGTNAKFDKFDPSMVGKRYGDKNGIFFSNVDSEAMSEANLASMTKGGEPQVHKANVTMKNPLIVKASDLPGSEYSYGHPINSYDSSRKYVNEAMTKGGYDGAIIEGTGGYEGNNLYIVKDAEQAKILNGKQPLAKSGIKLKPRELTPKPELQPIQPQRMTLSGNLPAANEPFRPVRQLGNREVGSIKPIKPIEQGPIKPITPKEVLNDPMNPNIPDAPTHPVAEHILSKLDDFEAAARARIAANKGRLNAGLPVDTLADYAIIGGVKIARGTVKYSVWAADMVADLGSSVKPHLKEIWEESNRQHSLMVDGTFNSALPKPQSDIIIGKQNERMGFKEAFNKFYTSVVDTTNPTSKVDETLHMKALNTKNVGGIVDYNFLKGMVDKNGNEVGSSLKSVVDAIPKGKEKDFWTYMSQRHNIDRARVESHEVPKVDKQGFLVKDKDGNQLYNTVIDKEATPVQANYTPNMSKQAVKIFEQENPEYKTIGDNIVRWLDDFMTTWGVDTGIVNKELYGNLRQTYKNYFPTQRDFSELEKAIPDNVSQKFVDQRTPIRKATGSERDIIDPTENIMQLVNRTIRTAKYNEVGQSLLNSVRQAPEKLKPLAEVIKTKDGMFSNKDNVITVMEDGKPVYLQINDKSLLDTMNGLPKSIGNIPILSTLTNGFKQLVTQSNPIFAVRNIFRDIPTAYVYGSEANPLKFGAGLIGAAKDIVTNSSRLQRYQAVGGGGANFFNSGDVTKSAAELTGKINPIKKVISAPVKAIQKFNNLTETMPRLAEFNRVLNKTSDVTKALSAANDVTVNFSRGGNITKNVDKVVPYLNAGVQGLDKFVRGFKDTKTAIQTIVKSGVAITTPTLALYLVNRDDPNYQALDNRTKDNYYLIPKGDGTFIKLPKSRELGVLFSSLIERGLRQAEGQENSFKGFGNTVATNFSPANPIDSNFFAPALEIIGKGDNKDFANRPIIPQSMIMDKRSDYLQYDDKTTSIAKAIGEMTKGMPGNEDGVSPKQLDYFVKSYTGVIGQFGIPLATPGGSPKKALTSQFTADPTFSNQITTDFYDKLDKLSTLAVDKNIIEKIPSKKLTPEEDMKNSMNGVSSALSRGTKLINSFQSSDDPMKEDRIKTIKSQMLELSRKSVLADTPQLMQKIENESKKYFK